MNWLSESAEVLFAKDDAARVFDVVVVGSGYGGAVAARRLAEAGFGVCLLERGREWQTGEFPTDLSQLGKHLRAESSLGAAVDCMGYEDALFDLRVGEGVGALVGNGLGGGSLINAGVGLVPDDAALAGTQWPRALRQPGVLKPWFDAARDGLGLWNPAGADALAFDPRLTEKFRSLQQLGQAVAPHGKAAWRRELEVDVDAVPLAVHLGRDEPAHELGPRMACKGCGNCVTGCNHDAKLSLVKSYLPAAKLAGAQLFTQVSVLRIVPDAAQDKDHPWVVQVVRTGERSLHRRIHASGGKRPGWTCELRAAKVVLAAGALGSTEILMRSRVAAAGKSPLAVSHRLGHRISGNGDDIAVVASMPRATNSVGDTSEVGGRKVGPTIAGAIRFTDPQAPGESTLLQDAAIPGVLTVLFEQLTQTLGQVARLETLAMPSDAGRDPLAIQSGTRTHTLTLLGMGHDCARGRAQWDAASDRLRWKWPKPQRETAPARHQARGAAVAAALSGRSVYLRNPASSVLPASLSERLQGAESGGSLFTVHPLGGCRMADSPAMGVCNDMGQVFSGRGADTAVHEGLFVVDGSLVPASLGVNPLLTITALAERACSHIVNAAGKGAGTRKGPAQAKAELGKPPSVPPVLQVPRAAPQPSVALSEVLRGPVRFDPSGLDATGGSKVQASLFVRMRIDDWPAFFDDPAHEVQAVPYSEAARARYAQTRLVIGAEGVNGRDLTLRGSGGTVRLYAARPAGWWVHLKAAARLLLTYWIWRWHPDAVKEKLAGQAACPARAPDPPQGPLQRLRKWGRTIKGGAVALWHASVVRTFDYRIELEDAGGERYHLRGTKVVDSAASRATLRDWLVQWRQGGWPAVERRSVWAQLTNLDVELHDAAQRLVLQGRLAMDLPDIVRNLLPELGPQRDTLTALAGLAGYPLLMLRGLLQTRLFDFRAPDYVRCLPKPDTHKSEDPLVVDLRKTFPAMEMPDWTVLPIVYHFDVPERATIAGGGGKIRLALVRYGQAPDALEVTADPAGPGRKVRAVMLINGFAQNTLAFVAPEMKGDALACRLHRAGWDVWMLEYRVSPLLPASARFSTMDDIAAFDIPLALDLACKVLGKEMAIDPAHVRMSVFSHCVGSASLAMAMAQGTTKVADGQGNTIQRVAAAVFSQFHPFVVGSNTAQQRLQFGSFVHNILGRDVLEFTAGHIRPDLLHATLDRVLSSMWQEGERCPGESDLRVPQPDTTTCKRMTGLLSGLFSHRKLGPEIHGRLDTYFGRTNLGVFLHGAKCVQAERLVDYDGRNYISDRTIKRCFDMPIMLMHGSDNRLFSPESLHRTCDQFRRAFGLNPARLGEPEPAAFERITSHVFEGHQHFDCTVGKAAARDIFPKIETFLERAWHEVVPQTPTIRRTMARLPELGPIIGWLRPHGDDRVRMRVWAQFDNLVGAKLVATVVVVNYREGADMQQVAFRRPFRSASLIGERMSGGNSRRRLCVRLDYLADDVDVPVGAQDVRVSVLGVYRYASAQFVVRQSVAASPAGKATERGLLPAPPVIQAGVRAAGVGSTYPLSDVVSLDISPADFFPGDLPKKQAPAATTDFPLGWPQDWGAPLSVEEVQGTEANSALGPTVPVSHRVHIVQAEQVDDTLSLVDNGVVLLGSARAAAPAPRAASTQEHLSPESVDALAKPLRRYLDVVSEVANRADPGTLSALIRNIRGLDDTQARLPDALFAPPNAEGAASFVAAGCRHPGITDLELARADHSFERLAAWPGLAKARLFAMLGDQVYVDARAGVFDVASGLERILPRYRRAFDSPGFRAVASRLPLAMVMDDHEIQDCWTFDHLRGSRQEREESVAAHQAYQVFQRAHGPDPKPAKWTYGNDYALASESLDMFVMDSRSQRALLPRRIMSEACWQRLEGWLALQRLSRRPKWLLSGAVVAPGLQESLGCPAPRESDTWQFAPKERARLLALIHRLEIVNVVLLSCDYHCAACATIELPPTASGQALKVLAVVAPPLHAPLRFANSEAASLAQTEAVDLGDGRGCAHVHLDHAWDGDGWLMCTQTPEGAGWDVGLEFQLQPMEAPAQRHFVRYALAEPGVMSSAAPEPSAASSVVVPEMHSL